MEKYEGVLSSACEKKIFHCKVGSKVKTKRHKANARERTRMHGLNAALDALRRCMPIKATQSELNNSPQKLSKIETLRLARNYISAMSQSLLEDRAMDLGRFIEILCRELSQTTSNLLRGSLMKSYNNNNNNSDIHKYAPSNYEIYGPDYFGSNRFGNYDNKYFCDSRFRNCEYFTEDWNYIGTNPSICRNYC